MIVRVCSMGACFLLIASAGMAQPKATATPAQTKTPATKSAAPAGAFNSKLLTPAQLKEQAPPIYEAKFTTTKGDFNIKVTREWAPRGADRFYNLVKHGFFDGATFFRAIAGFMVQFGISAHPQVSAPWREARINDDPVIGSNKKGFISFAMSGPNSRTTQVFINLVDNARLDPMGFSPFGEVTSGMEVVEALHSGYGEGAPRGSGPEQGRVQMEGRKYLEAQFPNLDSIKSAMIISPAPAAPAKSAPTKKSTATKSTAKKTTAKKSLVKKS